jgi:hypothetical protein
VAQAYRSWWCLHHHCWCTRLHPRHRIRTVRHRHLWWRHGLGLGIGKCHRLSLLSERVRGGRCWSRSDMRSSWGAFVTWFVLAIDTSRLPLFMAQLLTVSVHVIRIALILSTLIALLVLLVVR